MIKGRILHQYMINSVIGFSFKTHFTCCLTKCHLYNNNIFFQTPFDQWSFLIYFVNERHLLGTCSSTTKIAKPNWGDMLKKRMIQIDKDTKCKTKQKDENLRKHIYFRSKSNMCHNALILFLLSKCLSQYNIANLGQQCSGVED